MANDIRVDVRHDMKRAMVDLSNLRDTVVNKATYRGLNKALDRTATETSREIRKEYNVKHRAVMSALKKRRAGPKSLFAQMRIEGARIPLIEFGARQTRLGTTVQVKVKGGRKLVRSAFITTTRTGIRGVFLRSGKPRYPIRHQRSISIPQAISNKAVIAALQAITREEFSKEYERQLRLHGAG